jgi:hypothetical protein
MFVVKIIEHGPSVASTVEQLITAEAALMVLVNQIKANGYEVPQDLQTRLDECTAELNVKMRNDRQRQLKALELRLEQLLTNNEKRRNIEREIAALKNKLT